MNNIISFINDVPVVSTRVIADCLQVEHKAVIQIITKYTSDFEHFGRVTFEMEPFGTNGGQQERKISRLNEDQAALLLTYSKNTEQARRLKVRLIYEFRQLKESQHQLPQTFSEALLLAGKQAEKIEEQAAKIALDAPKVAYIEDYMKSDGLRGLQEAAKVLRFKPREFTEQLKADGFLYYLSNHLVPHQKHLDKKLFQLVEGIGGGGHAFSQTKITTTGMAYFAHRYTTELGQ